MKGGKEPCEEEKRGEIDEFLHFVPGNEPTSYFTPSDMKGSFGSVPRNA